MCLALVAYVGCSQLDFSSFCKEIEVPVEKMHELKNIPIELDDSEIPGSVRYGRSEIDGVGAFAGRDFNTSQIISPAYVMGKWTLLGRYANHSGDPNCVAIAMLNAVYFIAKRPIRLLDEFTVNYREVRECIKNLQP